MTFLESNAVELSSGIEDTILGNVIDFEVRIDLRLIEGIALLADFFGVVIPVPGR